MKIYLFIGIFGTLLSMLIACSPTIEVTQEPSATKTSPTGTQAPTLSDTQAPRPSATQTPTITASPQDTQTPIPTESSPEQATGIPRSVFDPENLPDSMQVVFIPEGEFMMGTDEGYSEEGPVHKVYLDAFYVDVYEVTNAQYAECVAAGGCTPPKKTWSLTRIKYYDDPEFSNYPVIYLFWQQAREYCLWRGGDLPTEAQWEKAARGGLEGQTYPWGDIFKGTEANFCDTNCTQVSSEDAYDDGFPDTAPVGSFAPNGYGLYDVAGNVWELTLDWYSPNYYSISPDKNPTGPENGLRKTLRGGSWWFGSPALRVTYREPGEATAPDLPYSDTGIRCVYTP